MTPEAVPSFLEAFKENPIWIFCAVVLGAFALVSLLLGFIILKKNPSLAAVFGGCAVGVGLMTIGAGWHGAQREHQRRDDNATVEGLTAADKERMRVYSDGGARWNIIAGLGASALPIALGAILVVVATRRKPSLPAM